MIYDLEIGCRYSHVNYGFLTGSSCGFFFNNSKVRGVLLQMIWALIGIEVLEIDGAWKFICVSSWADVIQVGWMLSLHCA